MDNAIFPAVSEPQTAMSTVVGLVERFETMSCCVVPVVLSESRNDWLSEVDTQDGADGAGASCGLQHTGIDQTSSLIDLLSTGFHRGIVGRIGVFQSYVI